MEKRRYHRFAVKDILFDATDGFGFFHGVISDVSRSGLCLTNIPKIIDCDTKKMTVIVMGPGKNFKMQVMPKWSAGKDLNKTLGAEILHLQLGWVEFIMNSEQKWKDDDAGERSISNLAKLLRSCFYWKRLMHTNW